MKDNDSDNDQGFVPTKVQIKADNKIDKNNKNDHNNMNRPTDFQGRYIFGDGLLRKQPIEVYQRFCRYLDYGQGSYQGEFGGVGNQGDCYVVKQQLGIQAKKIVNKSKLKGLTTYSQQKNSNNNNNNIKPNKIIAQTSQHQNNPNPISLQPRPTPNSSSKLTSYQPTTTTLTTTTQIAAHPYQKYISNENFTLIYSRYKDRIQMITAQSDDFSPNQINLSKVLSKYDPDHYSTLKAFQYMNFGGFSKVKNNSSVHGHGHYGNGSKNNLLNQDQNYNSHVKKNITYNIDHSQTTRQSHQNTIRIHSQTNNSHTHINPYNIHESTINNSQHSYSHPPHNTINYNPSAHMHNSSSPHGLHPHPHPHPHHQQNHSELNNNDQLEFDSKFQCGNLLYAFKNKKNKFQYILFLQNDTNSYGYNQWFYFSLRNMKKNISYKFTIVNLRKKHSLFKQGMKISVFSLIQAQNANGPDYEYGGWTKMGNNIKYERSAIKKYSDKKFKFYSLSFELIFKHEGDYVKVAMNIPYSYSRLIYHLNICKQIVKKNGKSQIKNNTHTTNSKTTSNSYKNDHNKYQQEQQQELNKIHWELTPVGYTISNNAVPYLTITNQKNIPTKTNQLPPKKDTPQQNINNSQLQTERLIKKKKAIIILSRQHPGQTWSSFMMQQILYLLAQNKSQKIKWLLQQYTFKIFPMVNVDGVIYGNFRCDLGGFDLNRNWRNPDKNLHPQVFSIKNQIEKIGKQYKIDCVLDLHGHSKQYNTFSYACKNDNITARVLSMVISQLNPIFHFPYCTFGLSKYKETTARANLYRLTGNQNILTIQNSFFGAKVNDKLIVYSPEIIKNLTQSILQGIFQYLSQSQLRTQCQQKIKKNIQEYLQYERIGEGLATVDSGSQSEPYIDQISIKDKIKKILPKSFKAIENQLEQEQKIMKKKPPPKKKQGEKKLASIIRDFKTINPSAPKKSRGFKQQQGEQQQSSKTFIQRTSLTYYKKNSKQLPKKLTTPDIETQQMTNRQTSIPIQYDKTVVRAEIMAKVGEVGLPFYVRQKATLVPIKLKNDSLQIFKDAYNATKLPENQSANNKFSMKSSTKKVKIISSIHNDNSQQFPLLCVLSQQKKKQSLLQKTDGIFSNIRQKQKISTSLPPKVRTYVQNQKLQILKRNIRNSKNQNNTSEIIENQQNRTNKPINQQSSFKNKYKETSIISKIWRQNFARYGKDLNVFFGGIRP